MATMSILSELPAQIELPTFIHERPGSWVDADNPFGRFDFWVPERLGDNGRDYAAGRRHFFTAVAFARFVKHASFLASIVGGMCKVGCGPIELGFIEELSCKATYGRLPG